MVARKSIELTREGRKFIELTRGGGKKIYQPEGLIFGPKRRFFTALHASWKIFVFDLTEES